MPSASSESRLLIEVAGLSKSFLGVRALRDVTFTLRAGELHCIIGENGAGKSTFIKVISGALTPDSGEIKIEGRPFSALTPHVAQRLGITAVYQENILVPQLSVAENLYVGREHRTRFGFFSRRETSRRAKEVLESFQLALRPAQLVEDLAPADMQLLKIVKAIESNPRVLIMDEPTASIDVEGIARVLGLVKSIKAGGIGIIYISHHLEEILEIADRITVLKDGRVAGQHDRALEDVTTDQLAREMIGRPLDKFYARQRTRIGNVVLSVSGLLLAASSKPISFDLRAGEILGIAGMAGSGRTEIVRALFGADPRKGGKVVFGGRDVRAGSPAASIRNGIGLLTEDRRASGLSLNRSVRENISILGLQRFTRLFMRLGKEARLVAASVKSLDIRTPSLSQEVRFLSGGNQQKVVLAKWLFREVDVLIFDEPTVGIDVNTKTEIYRLMADYVSRGKSIIMVSSEMPELISMSDRVLVIRQGSVSAVLEGSDITERNILNNSMGGRR